MKRRRRAPEPKTRGVTGIGRIEKPFTGRLRSSAASPAGARALRRGSRRQPDLAREGSGWATRGEDLTDGFSPDHSSGAVADSHRTSSRCHRPSSGAKPSRLWSATIGGRGGLGKRHGPGVGAGSALYRLLICVGRGHAPILNPRCPAQRAWRTPRSPFSPGPPPGRKAGPPN